MKKRVVLAALSLILVTVGIRQHTPALHAQDTTPGVFFDDFTYTDLVEDTAFVDNGWIARTADGWPGVPGAIWQGISVVDDFSDEPAIENNRLIELRSSTDGTTTTQAQFCQQRKFLEGTYAARVYFTDAPASGPDGDQIVQTFYAITPLEFDLDPAYSEMDFEYLPNGGWGEPENILFSTTWETFRPEPNWQAVNDSDSLAESWAGWHTLVVRVADGEVTYWIDDEEIGTHGDEYYPETPMSINFNLWFIRDGQISDSEMREWVEYVDWVYFTDDALEPADILTQVDDLRADATTFNDTVPALESPLDSPCNF